MTGISTNNENLNNSSEYKTKPIVIVFLLCDKLAVFIFRYKTIQLNDS